METFGSSRTDEGVHAMSNYYHFDIPDEEMSFDLLYKMNAILPVGIGITRLLKSVNTDFNARFSAISRRYRYIIYFRKNPFLFQRAMYYPFKFDKDILNESASVFLKYTDFESFAKRKLQSSNFECFISKSYWEFYDHEMHYVVEANRFLRGMVRGLVATQLQVARGNIDTIRLEEIINLKDSKTAYFDVPGWGLYLENIEYPEGELILV